MNSTTSADRVALGPTDIQISPLGVGAWAWGDKLFWQYGQGGFGEQDVEAAFQMSLALGINFFDTAEIYGQGQSERLLGRFAGAAGWPLVIATKFMPLPWRLRRRSLLGALRKSLQRLGLAQVDLYQIHWPFPLRSIETWMEGMADAVDAGLIKAVGVSNYSTEQMLRAHEALARRGVPLAANQVEFSLLQRQPEHNGLLDACQRLGVTLIAYSPLAKGLLTGKYTPEKRPPGMRGRGVRSDYLAHIQILIQLMREIGQEHGDKTPAQVALNWAICKGTVPIPGAKNARQAHDNAGALGWRLTGAQIAALDEVSAAAQR